MSFMNILRTALRGIAMNKLRAALTALGIVIGVASVITTLALGNGAQKAVEEKFRHLGSDEIQIGGKQMIEDGGLVPFGEILSYEDGLLMPGEVELIDRTELSVQGEGKVRYGRRVLDMTIVGLTADALLSAAEQGQVQPVGWPEGEPLNVEAFIDHGRVFSPEEVLGQADVCVLGFQTAEDLFEGDEPVGEVIRVNRERCLVIGVVAELETVDPEQRSRSQVNEALYMPISTAINNLYDEEPSVAIVAHVNDENRMAEAKAQVAAYLRQRHNIEKDSEGEYKDDFSLSTKKDILGAQQEAAQTFSFLLVALAIVSLTVGGIGIMNVMLVSVTERTREIGVRMAVGARQRDIVTQFMLETTLLSAASGLLGIAVGILIIPLAAFLNQGTPVLDPLSIPLSFIVALLIGTIFGLYPAIRAAGFDPVRALRYE
jgi:ABC-type antimicrobial peptide transport system permease subunit